MFSCRHSYLPLVAIVLTTILTITGCYKEDNIEEETQPPAFPQFPEDNTGSRTRSLTYVYDRTAVDSSYPPKIDSSLILFAYTATGKIDRIRLSHNNDFLVYDFTFARDSISGRLNAIHCNIWKPSPYIETGEAHLFLKYNAAGTVSLLKVTANPGPANEADSFIIKSTANRIDTVIDGSFTTNGNAEKYAYTYNGTGDIIQMDHIHTTGVFWVYEDVYKYTLSGNQAALVMGNEAIYWDYFANYVDVSSNTDFIKPPILFHSSKQPSKLVFQKSGFYTGTYNYQTEYYSTGRPKRMTANVITETGAFYAREAYYYTYTQ